VVYHCPPSSADALPDYATRRKIENLVRKSVHEHLIIFTNADCSIQKWQWVRHEIGKPTVSREYEYARGQSGELLLQRLQTATFSLDEEEKLTLTDVTSRVQATFDLDKVTKKFYDRFKNEHQVFLRFIEGIPDETLQRWYVSVTINRLMFVYFIQKKGFLDQNVDYLRDKLAESKQTGDDHFYRDYLCLLFFEGFARKESERTPASRRVLGKIPYLNGGIFQRHQLEERLVAEHTYS
jgi:hypothetical protein